MLPLQLILGDDDLARVNVPSVGNGVTQDADGSDHLTHFGGAIHTVAGVTYELLASCNLWWVNTGQRSEVMECWDYRSSI